MADSRLHWREMLPIVTRELRVASKRRVTYRLRLCVAALAASLIFFGGFLPGWSVTAGQALFWFTSFAMLLICGWSGLVLTADSISREKREGTLGLLFLTRLSGADVVLGKLTVAALSGASVAFAALPFLAFSLCLGGVTGREFWIMSALLLFLLAFSLALGVFISTLFRREAVVTLIFSLAMSLPLAVIPLALLKWKTIPGAWAYLNPYFPAMALLDSAGRLAPGDLALKALLYQGALMFLMILGACLILPWMVRTRPLRPKLADQWELPLRARVRTASRATLLDLNPVLWLTQRHNHPLLLLWVCAGLWLVVGSVTKNPLENAITYVALMALLPKLFVLWHASGMMAAERQSGFLETLLTTPVSAGEVLQGKIRAIKRQIAPALLFSMLAQWATAMHWWAADGSIPISSTLIFASMLTLLIDVHAIAWVGLWQGLSARDRRRALIRSVLVGIIGPWVPALGACAMIIFLFEPKWMTDPAIVLPPLLISVNVFTFAIACIGMARLHEKFRSTATATWSFRTAH